jgi:signal peptidase II
MKRLAIIALLLVASLFFLFLDFYSKAWAYSFLPLASNGLREIPVFHDVLGVDFSITLALNRGAAWGMLSSFQDLILVLRLLVIASMLSYLFFFPHDRRREIPLLLIVTGAFGNVLDYFIYGQVVDFLRFNLWGYPFPIFNLADSLITVGVAAFFLVSYFSKPAHAAAEK